VRRASALAARAALVSRLRAASEPQLRALGDVCAALARATPLERPFVLGGPTGERNTWWLTARRAVLGVARDDADRLFQLAHAIAAGAPLLWPEDRGAHALSASLPEAVRAFVRVVEDVDTCRFDAAIVHGSDDEIRHWSVRLAQRDGPIVALLACTPGDRRRGAIALERLFVERTLSVNTAAAGGNASLMALG
jgi:RHH-type proline utilization regulon transcriptional repressor/proline dehydrogenase/delta 1-pyrroline-5-carboxylate dehydrogenase